MDIDERQYPAKVIPGEIVQEFNPVTHKFVRQYFNQTGKFSYQIQDGTTTGRDAFLDDAGEEYTLPLTMFQPEGTSKPEPIVGPIRIDLDEDQYLIINTSVESFGILEGDEDIKSMEPLEQLKAQLCNASIEGMLTLVGQIARRGVDIGLLKTCIMDSLNLIGDFYA